MHRVRSLGVSVVLLFAAASAPAGELEDAAALSRAGRFSEAQDHYERAVAADPANEAAVTGLAETLMALGKPADAGRVLDAGLEKHPDSLDLLVHRGRAALDQAEEASRFRERGSETREGLARARTCFEAVLGKDPKHTGGRILKGRWTLRQEDIDPGVARKMFEEARAEAPGDYEANFQLGKFWFFMGTLDNKSKENWGKAEESFRAAAKARPGSGAALYNVALAKQWRGASARDLRLDYEKAAELAPDLPGLLFNLLKLYPDPGPQAALYDRLLEKFPENPNLISGKAGAMYFAGQKEEAMAYLATREKAMGGDPRIILAEGIFRVVQVDIEGAVKEFIRSVEACKGVMRREVYDFIDLFSIRSSELLTAEQRDRLWTALWKAFPSETNGPNNAQVWFRDTGKDVKKSVEWCERGLAINPADAGVLNDMGVNFSTRGYLKYDLAVAEEWWMKAVAAAEAQKVNQPDRSVGYMNAVDNIVKQMLSQRRWADMEAFALKHLKEDPRYDTVMQLAKTHGSTYSGGSAPGPDR